MIVGESAGDRSNIFLVALEGSVEDCGDYLCLRTPSNPDYMWGNYLHFSRAPRSEDYSAWTASYRKHFGDQSWFMAFSWNANSSCRPEQVQDFLNRGFIWEEAGVFTAHSLQAPRRKVEGLTVRPVETDEAWARALENHIRVICTSTAPGNDQKEFARYRYQNFRKLFESGYGHVFEAFLRDQAVGQMGIFVKDGIARFQKVMVHPEFRGQGICRNLCYQAVTEIRERFPVETFVTVADDSMAIAAYCSIGFEQTETSCGLRWYDLKLRSKRGS